MNSQEVFCDINVPLTGPQAQVEASRCYYCYDAPCIQACPTQIDIPSFIRKIGNGNVRGAAMDILGANIMGGTCARACPVETLCQSACVREHSEKKPVAIGQLQRFATDQFLASGEQPFKRKPSNGMKVAVVGAGPAGLSCAHTLAREGYDVTVFEKNAKSGGLNEYGLAPYKMTNDFAQKEVKFILSIGGIEIKHGQTLGKDFRLADLQKKYAAVFVGVGLGSTNKLNIPGEDLPGVMDAVVQIAKIRQGEKVAVGRNAVVIGGGNTAVDIAIQMKRLGAESVTLAYRRSRNDMGATHHEQELAQTEGVLLKTFATPVEIQGDGKVESVRFQYTGKSEHFTVPADQVFKAIGQKLAVSELETQAGKILVNEEFAAQTPRVFAGGDCIQAGEDLTVTAVQQGKLAAREIDRLLRGAKNG